MLADIINFLLNNPDVLEKVQEGTASLIGLSETEQRAILDVLSSAKHITMSTMSTMSYWE